MKEIKSNKQGTCPFCGSDNLDYQPVEMQDDGMMFYPWTCQNCKAQGEEWYSLTFVGHNVIDPDTGEEIELED